MRLKSEEVIFLNSVFFVIGFVLVFSVVGILLQTLVAGVAVTLANTLRIIGGVVIIGFGILLIASARYRIPFFSGEYRIRVKRSGNSFISSLVFGVAFAIGWTPCVGPILGAIYTLAITSPGTGFLLLLAFSLGLGIPFLLAGAFISRFSLFLKSAGRFLRYFNVIGGALLIALGLLVVSDYIGLLSVFLLSTNGYVALNGSLDFIIAIAAGILTFLSPCILPLVPAYFAYIGGTVSDVVKG